MRPNIGIVPGSINELDGTGSFERRRSLESRVFYFIQCVFRGVIVRVGEAISEIQCVTEPVPRYGREVRSRYAPRAPRARGGGRSVGNDHPGRREHLEGLRNAIAVRIVSDYLGMAIGLGSIFKDARLFSHDDQRFSV